MPQFFRFSMQVTFILAVFADLQRNAFDYTDSRLLQRTDFFGIVGQQFDFVHTEMVVNVFGQ